MPAAAQLTDRGQRALLGNALAPRLFVRLFTNDAPVLPGSALVDFAAATFPGYADLEVTALWSAPALDLVGRASSRAFNLSWTRGAGPGVESIFGWVLYQLPAPDSFIVAGQRFGAPYVMDAPGRVVLFSILAYLLKG